MRRRFTTQAWELENRIGKDYTWWLGHIRAMALSLNISGVHCTSKGTTLDMHTEPLDCPCLRTYCFQSLGVIP